MEMEISQIENQLRHIKQMCQDHVNLLEDTEEKALMTAAAEVLNGLEKAFHTCFHEGDGASHIVSPKSSEPWD
jgi:hypothetical protein